MASKSEPARVFTSPPGVPFLRALARAVLSGELLAAGAGPPSPAELASYTILLPTRRAVRALQAAFLSEARGLFGTSALVLPQMRPLASDDEDHGLVAQVEAMSLQGRSELDVSQIKTAVSPLERRFMLTELVMRWSTAMRQASDMPLSMRAIASGASTPGEAVGLADALARLLDMAEAEDLSLARLNDPGAQLVPDELSAHWKDTLEFLKIVMQWWPDYLQSQNLTGIGQHQNELIRLDAAHIARGAGDGSGLVIAAGLSRTTPATRELLVALKNARHGRIVLQGLATAPPQGLDEAAWSTLVPAHPEHPDFAIKRLLDAIGVNRTDVAVLQGLEPAAGAKARQQFLGEALRPTSSAERWMNFIAQARVSDVAAGLKGLSVLALPGPQDEAEAIALILREALETPGRTASLVTPDRGLARRVSARMSSLGIAVDDSAGLPLARTRAGSFLDLIAEAAAHRFRPVDTMALLHHPLTRLGLGQAELEQAAQALELIALRDIYIGRDLAGLRAALEDQGLSTGRKHQAVRRLPDTHVEAAFDLLDRLEEAFAPLVQALDAKATLPFRDLLNAHVTTAEALSAAPAQDEAAVPLWSGEDGEAAALALANLLDPHLPVLAIQPGAYTQVYRRLLAQAVVRPRIELHPRLSILGPLEARLQHADVMILGSFNDGIWPEIADPGPWLSRSMLADLGLPSPEERVGQAAHDAVHLMMGPRVFVTRALKVDGVPTKPSRWLLRMEALLKGLGLEAALKPDQPWASWVRARDEAGDVRPVKPPAPRPVLALRPRKLAVTEVETWMANPYAIFARHVLQLEPLIPLGEEPGPSLRGAMVHASLADFTKRWPKTLPNDSGAELMSLILKRLTAWSGSPRVAAIWAPRFARFAEWFGETEPGRRAEPGFDGVVSEVKGALVIEGPAGSFELTTRIDRIDVATQGLTIFDYKSGGNLATLVRRANAGNAPQLALEAAIVSQVLLAGVPKRDVARLVYISASGGEPPGKEWPVDGEAPTALAQAALTGLNGLIAAYDDAGTPYRALRRSGFRYEFDAYASLARVSEWLGANDEPEVEA